MKSKARIKANGEIFTSPVLVNEILDTIDFDWSDPKKTILEPSVGEGAFIDGILPRLMNGLELIIPDPIERHKHIFENMIFAIDIMQDNIDVCIERFNLKRLRHHFIVHDALTYSYKFNEWDDSVESLFEWPVK